VISFVLDTDILSCLQRGDENVVSRSREHDPAIVATTIVSAEEQLRGRLEQVAKAQNSRKTAALPSAYDRLREAIEFFRTVPLASYTQDAEECYRALRKNGVTHQKVGTLDLRIGCIALALGATLVTRNLKHFRNVPNLKVEDWST